MLVFAGGLAVYGLTTVMGGSGFLAIYLAGVVIGNRAPRESRNIVEVHNGFAWLAQIAMFLMLGLLATPSDLVEHAPAALAIALVLMFVARPLAVGLCLLPFRFPWREQAFIAWVGLRGAVPIILALFPLLGGLPEAKTILDVAFFVVLVSLTLQGWTIPLLARKLRLQVPPAPGPDERLDLAAVPEGRHAFFGFRLSESSQAVGLAANQLALHGAARAVAVLRGGDSLAPEAAGKLAPGDLVYVLGREEDSTALGELFSSAPAPEYLEKRQFYGDFTLRGDARMEDLALMYGLPVPEGAGQAMLADFLAARQRGLPVVGDRFRLGSVEFVVREIEGKRISRVGLRIPTHMR
jgi:cell volume regulation protein A